MVRLARPDPLDFLFLVMLFLSLCLHLVLWWLLYSKTRFLLEVANVIFFAYLTPYLPRYSSSAAWPVLFLWLGEAALRIQLFYSLVIQPQTLTWLERSYVWISIVATVLIVIALFDMLLRCFWHTNEEFQGYDARETYQDAVDSSHSKELGHLLPEPHDDLGHLVIGYCGPLLPRVFAVWSFLEDYKYSNHGIRVLFTQNRIERQFATHSLTCEASFITSYRFVAYFVATWLWCCDFLSQLAKRVFIQLRFHVN